MAQQHVHIMKGLGMNDDQIKAVEGLTDDQLKDWKPDNPESLKIFNPAELVTGVQTGLKNILSNDADFLATIPKEKINPAILTEIEKGQYARFQNELIEVATKKLGLEDKELTADDRKSIKGLAEKIAVTYLGKKGSVDGLKQMQADLQKALQEKEELVTKHGDTLKTELEKANGLNSAKLIKTLTKVELSGLDDIELSVAAKFISDPALNNLSAKYTVVLDENDNLDIKQKADKNLDVLDKAGKKITFAQALREAVLEEKLGKEVKVDPNDPKKKKIIVNPGDGGGDDVKDVPDYIKEKIVANGG
jgi:hypothetical protein